MKYIHTGRGPQDDFVLGPQISLNGPASKVVVAVNT